MDALSTTIVSPMETLQTVSAMFGVNFWLVLMVLLGVTVFFCIVFWKLFKKMGHK